jgi:hypothetical protein
MTDNAEDLIAELRQETENAGIGSTSSEPKERPAEEINIESDFEQSADQPRPEQPQEPELTPTAVKGMAHRYVKMASTFLKMILTPLYRKTILIKGDVEKMDAFRKKHSGKSEKQMDEALTSDDAMWPVVNRFDAYMKAVKDIPFDEDETDMIAIPLAELIVKYKALRLSPEWMFVIAIGMTMLPRLTKLMPDVNQAEQK